MFKIVLGFCLVCSLALLELTYGVEKSSNRFTNAQVISVYERLAANSGEQGLPPLTIADNADINAWTDGKNITITTGILAVMENEDELALVLGHEMAHYINHDMLHEDLDSRSVEAHADKLGAFIMMRAGFDVCKGKEMFKVFKEQFGDSPVTTSHPDNAFRRDQLDLPQCDRHFFDYWF